MGKLLHEDQFKHVHYNATDVRKTFARERKRLADEKDKRESEQAAAQIELATKVRRIGK